VTHARRAGIVLSVVTLAIGSAGLVAARDLALTSAQGEILFGLGVSFNPLGALVTIALGLLALSSILLRDVRIIWVVVAGALLGVVQVLVQFGRDDNWLGTRGSNLSFFLSLALGMWSLAWLERLRPGRGNN
jgi:hypothetical protein